MNVQRRNGGLVFYPSGFQSSGSRFDSRHLQSFIQHFKLKSMARFASLSLLKAQNQIGRRYHVGLTETSESYSTC